MPVTDAKRPLVFMRTSHRALLKLGLARALNNALPMATVEFSIQKHCCDGSRQMPKINLRAIGICGVANPRNSTFCG